MLPIKLFPPSKKKLNFNKLNSSGILSKKKTTAQEY